MAKQKLVKQNFSEMLTDLNRNQLGSISLKDINDVTRFTTGERKQYLQDAEVLWTNPVFQNEIKKMIQVQLEFMGNEATEISQVFVARGTINGVQCFHEWIEMLHNEYTQLNKPEEDFDPLS